MVNGFLRFVLSALAVAGIVVSMLALRVHRMDPNAAPPCEVTEKWDCGTVNHGRYAVFPALSVGEEPDSGKLHVPVAAVGIAGYSLMLIFAALGLFRVVLPLATVGFGCAAYLTYIEANVIHKWCIYCVWSQGIVATLLLATVVAVVLTRRSGRTAAPAGA